MKFETTHEFPEWVHQYNPMGERDKWPIDYQELADEIYRKADDVARKWAGVGIDECPIDGEEVSNHLGADISRYEFHPIFCCNKGSRPDEWNLLYDSMMINQHSRSGGLYETQIGNWYFVCGFDYD